MRLMCKQKDTGKRLLVDTNLVPDYKDLYNDEQGKSFSKDYNCDSCNKKFKTSKGAENHSEKCKLN